MHSLTATTSAVTACDVHVHASCNDTMEEVTSLLCCCQDRPISGTAEIELRGDYFTDDITIQGAPNVGSKVLG